MVETVSSSSVTSEAAMMSWNSRSRTLLENLPHAAPRLAPRRAAAPRGGAEARRSGAGSHSLICRWSLRSRSVAPACRQVRVSRLHAVLCLAAYARRAGERTDLGLFHFLTAAFEPFVDHSNDFLQHKWNNFSAPHHQSRSHGAVLRLRSSRGVHAWYISSPSSFLS
jgi:hypothetical protein